MKAEDKTIKAYFLDYTGTMVQEDEPYTRELLGYFLSHSNFKNAEEALTVVWGMIKKLEAGSRGENFIKNDEKVERILSYCTEHYGLWGDLTYMHDVWRKVWVHAPLFDDVRPFFERTALPVYVLSNDDLCYLEESMRLKDLHPAGIIAAEMAGACKPDKAIFDKALEVAGIKADEAVHIGDSMTSDVEAARAAGITPVYICRNGSAGVPEGVRVIRSLDEL